MKSIIFNPFWQIDPIILGFYDAFILYARAMKRLYTAGYNYTDGLTAARAMWNTTVRTPLKTDIVMTDLGDKVIYYDIRSFSADRGTHTVS